MGHRMVLGYGDGLTIFLKDHVKRQQAESPLHDVATNFQFVEPLSVSRHCPTNPTRSTVPRRTSLKTCSTIVRRRSEANQRGPASRPIDHGRLWAFRAEPPKGVPPASRIVPGRQIPRRGYFPQPGVGAQHLPRVGAPQRWPLSCQDCF